MCTYGQCVTHTIYYRGLVVSDTGPRAIELTLPHYLTWRVSFARHRSNLMSLPTNTEIIPGHNRDDLVMEGEASEDEGDHAPKKHRIGSPRRLSP
jgi:hypothetical protein